MRADVSVCVPLSPCLFFPGCVCVPLASCVSVALVSRLHFCTPNDAPPCGTAPLKSSSPSPSPLVLAERVTEKLPRYISPDCQINSGLEHKKERDRKREREGFF